MRRPGRRNLFVVGFMASGKTRLARLLAERLGWRFVDTDAEVERAAGRTVAELFRGRGEPHFRRLERRAIARAARGLRRVVSVGGGAVLDPANRAALRRGGRVVYRQTPFEVLFKRAERKGSAKRPLWNGRTRAERRRAMAELYARRRPLYREVADIVVRAADAGRALERVLRELR